MRKAKGVLEVGSNEHGEVVVNHPDLQPDDHGVGHIIFSPAQARHFATLLNRQAREAERAKRPAKVEQRTEYCGDCDGCGWYEGGPTLKTTCCTCNGTGLVAAVPRPGLREPQ